MPGSYIPYTTNLPLARAVDDDVLLVHTWEGEPLPREHGGPVRMITPKLYAWKGTKWIRKIEFLAEDRRGFWEVRGYSNSAEPWFNDRYSRNRFWLLVVGYWLLVLVVSVGCWIGPLSTNHQHLQLTTNNQPNN